MSTTLTLNDIEARSHMDPNGGCWLWGGSLSGNGYAMFSGKPVHRLSLALKLGAPIKKGCMSCHACDVRCCVNPGHLYEGTPLDNAFDRMARGRSNRALWFDESLRLPGAREKYMTDYKAFTKKLEEAREMEPLALDLKTFRTLDRKRAMTGESRIDFVRRLIEEHY